MALERLESHAADLALGFAEELLAGRHQQFRVLALHFHLDGKKNQIKSNQIKSKNRNQHRDLDSTDYNTFVNLVQPSRNP